MHTIHTTPGFIIDARPSGEAGKLLFIFTRDYGLVATMAQGIRLEKSKLRYHTQEYSLGIFSLVRGKDLWRLTSAGPLGDESVTAQLSARHDDKEIIIRIALLLRRLLHGEEPHPELFDIFHSCITFLNTHNLSVEEHATLESLVVLRMLHALGYIGKDVSIQEYVTSQIFSNEMLTHAESSRKLINQHINKALRESHL